MGLGLGLGLRLGLGPFLHVVRGLNARCALLAELSPPAMGRGRVGVGVAIGVAVRVGAGVRGSGRGRGYGYCWGRGSLLPSAPGSTKGCLATSAGATSCTAICSPSLAISVGGAPTSMAFRRALPTEPMPATSAAATWLELGLE